MNFLVVGRLLARRSLVITFGASLVLVIAMQLVQHGSVYNQARSVRYYFSLMYGAVAVGALISFGGFVAKATSELEGIRLCHTVPGLRRRINGGVLLVAAATATVATGFIYLTISDFARVQALPLWLTSAFLFSLGFGLGWSWLMFIAVTVFLSKLRWILEELRTAPLSVSLMVTVGAALLLLVRHSRFLAPARKSHPGFSIGAWLSSSLSIGVKPRRAGQSLPDRPGWRDSTLGVSLSKLVRAGVYERLGHQPGLLLGRVIFSVALIHLMYDALLAWASTQDRHFHGLVFVRQVLGQRESAGAVDVLRVLFAAITGGVSYVGALLFDTSLTPDLWHPVSRRRRGRAIFLSHLRQNLIFAAVHLSVTFGFLMTAGKILEIALNAAVLRAFLLPTILAFMLMPIPQAIFPNAVQVFRGKVNALMQFSAGLVGGLFCILICRWTVYWPMKFLHELLSPGWRGALLVATTAAIYVGYYAFLLRRSTRTDLRYRTA